jgi:hypothetical protein
MKIAITMALFALVIFVAGCAHIYHMSIDSINDGQKVVNQTYVIVPGDPNIETADIQFREFSVYVGRALKTIGYTAAPVNQAPDVEIYLSYGLGSPQTHVRTYSVPVWGQTGTDIITSENNMATRTGTNRITTTSINPEYGVTSYATQEENYTTYPKYIEIDAYNIKNVKPGARPEELWKTTIHSEGKKNELRHAFPILVAAAAKYLGGNTGQEIEISFSDDQESIKTIRGINE